jgi:lysophospholipase L1-like esterase
MFLRRLVTGLVALAVIFLGVPGFSAAHAAETGPRKDPQWTTEGDARACSGPIWPASLNTTPGPGQGRRVLVIGDSLTRNGRAALKRQLRADGWTPTVRCFGGKRLDWAIAQAKRAKALGQLPDTVVIAMGTNDMRWIDRRTTQGRMKDLMRVLGKKRTVLWVDTYASGGDRFTGSKEKWFNQQVKLLAQQRENLHHVVWGKWARANDVAFADALHYTTLGTRTWARRVADEVSRIAR